MSFILASLREIFSTCKSPWRLVSFVVFLVGIASAFAFFSSISPYGLFVPSSSQETQILQFNNSDFDLSQLKLVNPVYPLQEVYGISVYLLNVGDINDKLGTFSADFYLMVTPGVRFRKRLNDVSSSRSVVSSASRSRYRSLQPILFMNAVDKPTITGPVQKLSDNGGNYEDAWWYRVKGSFYFIVNSERYPYDTRILPIKIEDSTRHIDSLVFQPLNDQLRLSSRISFVGFSPKSAAFESVVSNYSYVEDSNTEGMQLNSTSILVDSSTNSGSTGKIVENLNDVLPFSRVTFRLILQRNMAKSWFTIFLPPTIIVIIALNGFRLPMRDHQNRIEVGGICMISISALYIRFGAQDPDFNRITLGEVYLIICFCVAAWLIISTVIVSSLIFQNLTRLAIHLGVVFDRSAIMASPVVLLPVLWGRGYDGPWLFPFGVYMLMAMAFNMMMVKGMSNSFNPFENHEKVSTFNNSLQGQVQATFPRSPLIGHGVGNKEKEKARYLETS